MIRLMPYVLLTTLCVVLAAAHSQAVLQDKHKHMSHEQPHSDEIICRDNTCYPRIFRASNEFQVIHDDQVVPPGLHIRMDFESGLREGKIVDPTDDDSTLGAVYVGPGSGDVIAVANPGAEEKEDRKASLIDLLPLVQPVKPNPRLTSETWNVFKTSMDVIEHQSESPDEAVIGALAYLEDASHEVEFGVKITESSSVLISLISLIVNTSKTADIRSEAAIVLGNSFQNNPAACLAAGNAINAHGVRVDIITPLLTALSREASTQETYSVQCRIMYAIARAICIPGGHKDFIQNDGLQTLLKVFTASSDQHNLYRKIIAFIDDEFLNGDMLDERLSGSNVLDTLGLSQREITKVKEDLGKWCQYLPQFIKKLAKPVREDESDDTIERILRPLRTLMLRYPKYCQKSQGIVEQHLVILEADGSSSGWHDASKI